jgi:hypothetical protein
MTNEQMKVLIERALHIPVNESDAAWILAGVEDQFRKDASQQRVQPTICPACQGGIVYSGNGVPMPCDVCHKIGQSG